MRSKISEEPAKPTYPCLRRFQDTTLIVLFTSLEEGTVVSPDLGKKLGKHSTDWLATNFVPFNGAVELSNEPE